MKANIESILLIALLGLLPASGDQPDLATLQAQAAKGDPEAELALGRAYHLGKGIPKDFAKAADLYRQAAAQGNAKAMYNLGYIYDNGQGVTPDPIVAEQWFQKSADQALPAGQLAVGLSYYFGDHGLTQDYAAAAKWLTLAAQQKDAVAQSAPAANTLGSLSEQGRGVTMDGAQAVFWYTQAAETGYAKAQSNLGRLYDEGLTVKRDRVHSYMWLKLAAYQGEPVATHMLSESLGGKELTPEEKAEGDRLAAEFQAKHHGRLMPANLTLPPPLIPPDLRAPAAPVGKLAGGTVKKPTPSPAPATNAAGN